MAAQKIENLITDHLDLWTAAVRPKSSAGRGSNSKLELTGIKKLRELILELAVRGKLVPQDPNDEPAVTLLDRLVSERDEWLEEEAKANSEAMTMLRKLKKLTAPKVPFELPQSWTCVHLIQLSRMLVDCHNKTAPYVDTGIPIIRTTNIRERQFIEKDLKFINQETYDYWSRRCKPEPGDIIFTREAPMGEALIIPEEAQWCLGQRTMLIRPMHKYISSEFLLFALTEPHLLQRASEHAVGLTVKHLRVGDVENLNIPLPPLAEQHRIVAKVDEIMALCDQLEQRSESQLAAHQTLVETLLATLTNSANADELAQNWARLSTHFDTLFTTEASIDALKQTILQLAVMGKLVPQDPSDEPASALLARIAAEKAQLVKEKKIKKEKPLPAISENEKPFELPKGWEWCRLPDLGELARGKSKHRPRNDPKLYVNGTIPLVQTGDVARADGLIESYTAMYNEIGLAQSKLWPKGTLCITIAANIADTGILGFDACFPDSVVGYTPYESSLPVVYFDFFIRTAKENLEKFAPSTAQKNINLEILSNILVPCPPTQEFIRIVSRVNDLFAICDQLKTRLQTSQQTQLALAESLVEGALV